jgi:hypothetical protein
MEQSQGIQGTQGTVEAPSRETLSQRFSSLFGSSSSSSSSSSGTDPTSALESAPASGPMASFRWVLWALLFVVVVWLVYLIMKTVRINDMFAKFLASLPVAVQKWFAQLSPQQQDKIKTEVVKKKEEELHADRFKEEIHHPLSLLFSRYSFLRLEQLHSNIICSAIKQNAQSPYD